MTAQSSSVQIYTQSWSPYFNLINCLLPVFNPGTFSITVQRISLGLLRLWVKFKLVIHLQKHLRIARRPTCQFLNQTRFQPYSDSYSPLYLQSLNAEVLGNFRKTVLYFKDQHYAFQSAMFAHWGLLLPVHQHYFLRDSNFCFLWQSPLVSFFFFYFGRDWGKKRRCLLSYMSNSYSDLLECVSEIRIQTGCRSHQKSENSSMYYSIPSLHQILSKQSTQKTQTGRYRKDTACYILEEEVRV